MVAAAIGIGSAVAGIGGSILSSGAASSAASEQASAAQQAADTQAAAADRATQAAQAEAAQTRADLAPYNVAGQNAAATLQSTLGLSGGNGQNLLQQNGLSGLVFQPTQAQLAATPGYQFNLNQGEQGVANSNAAQGLGISGAALKGAANYAVGLANNTLGTQQGIFQQNLNNVLNPLQNLSNLGENAAAQTGSLGTQNIANANAANIGGANAQAAGTVGAANAQAAGTVGSANAISGGLNSIGSSALNYSLYNQLLGNGNSWNNNANSGNFGNGDTVF